jgi:tRNA threonylcarbamoyladenosine biosynthesis protein TsaE
MAAPWIVNAATAADTQALAERLGRLLAPGDVLALLGPLGAGKTTFIQGLARGLEVPPDRNVASPTFALVNEHPDRVPLVHADLYRIENAGELP